MESHHPSFSAVLAALLAGLMVIAGVYYMRGASTVPPPDHAAEIGALTQRVRTLEARSYPPCVQTERLDITVYPVENLGKSKVVR